MLGSLQLLHLCALRSVCLLLHIPPSNFLQNKRLVPLLTSQALDHLHTVRTIHNRTRLNPWPLLTLSKLTNSLCFRPFQSSVS